MHHFATSLADDRRSRLLAEARESGLAAQVPARRPPSATRRVRSAWTAALAATSTRPYLRRTA